MKLALTATLAAALSLALMAPSSAHAADGYNSAGTWSLGAGLSHMDNTGNNTGLNFDQSTRFSATGEYFVINNLGVEVFAAAPFSNDIYASGIAGRLAENKTSQSILLLKYHFNSDGRVSPYLGAGVGYADFHGTNVDPTGPIAGNTLGLSDTWGGAANAGLDFKLNGNSAIRADVRWMESRSNVFVNGTNVGDQRMDPLTYGVSYVFQF